MVARGYSWLVDLCRQTKLGWYSQRGRTGLSPVPCGAGRSAWYAQMARAPAGGTALERRAASIRPKAVECQRALERKRRGASATALWAALDQYWSIHSCCACSARCPYACCFRAARSPRTCPGGECARARAEQGRNTLVKGHANQLDGAAIGLCYSTKAARG